MTERKPQGLGFTSWIDQQVADAERRGVFDGLPGTGKPLSMPPRSADGDYGQAWLRDYARREGVDAEEMLPAPLRLRREVERLRENAGEFRSEAELREAVSELNRRIVEWRRIPVGPPVHVPLANADEMTARWRAAHAASSARAAQEADAGQPGEAGSKDPRPGGWRRYLRLFTASGSLSALSAPATTISRPVRGQPGKDITAPSSQPCKRSRAGRPSSGQPLAGQADGDPPGEAG